VGEPATSSVTDLPSRYRSMVDRSADRHTESKKVVESKQNLSHR
jgi:hypothetical protein